MNVPVLPPANSWQGVAGCSTGVEGSPSITYGITITGVPAQIGALNSAGSQYVWTITLNDGNTPPNFTIDRWDGAGNLIDHPIEISGLNGSITFNDPVYLSEDPVQPPEAATKHYVDSVSLLGQDVPMDGNPYVRQNGTWLQAAGPNLPYLPIGGGYLTGAVGIAAAANQRFWAGFTAAQVYRWQVYLGDGTPESGSNNGANFNITSYSDIGANPTVQMSITRNGVTTFPNNVNIGNLILASPSSLKIAGGLSGQSLVTDGASNLFWTTPTGGAGIPEAPLDGNQYARQDATWTEIIIPPPIPPVIPTDAPANGQNYARNNNAWSALGSMAAVNDAPAISGNYYTRYLNGWVSGSQVWLPLSGGNMSGSIVFNGTPASRAIAGFTGTTTRWSQYWGDTSPESGSNTGANLIMQRYADNGTVIDTPFSIARNTGIVSMVDGATVLAPAASDNTSRVPTTAWVNSAIAAIPPPPAGSSVTISDTAPASPSPGNLWWDSVGGQMYVWYVDPTTSQWVSVTNQLGNFLPISGGTLTGTLILAGDPVNNLSPATKQYVDAVPAPLVSAGGSFMSAHMSADQAIGATGTVVVNFDTVDFDTNSEFNASTHLFTAKRAGYYRVSGVLLIAIATAGGGSTIYVFVNGAQFMSGSRIFVATANQAPIFVVDAIVHLNVGDTTNISAGVTSGWTISGGAGASYCRFQVQLLALG